MKLLPIDSSVIRHIILIDIKGAITSHPYVSFLMLLSKHMIYMLNFQCGIISIALREWNMITYIYLLLWNLLTTVKCTHRLICLCTRSYIIDILWKLIMPDEMREMPQHSFVVLLDGLLLFSN